MRSLVCLSGGLDSALVMLMAKEQGECQCVAFDYGQPHLIELKYARNLAEKYSVPLDTVSIPNMPKINDVVFAGRNLVFAALTAASALTRDCDTISFGCNKSDWNRFPDCRPVFWKSVKAAIFDGYGVKVATPLLHMTKQEIVIEARIRGLNTNDTWSCYAPRQDDTPCGVCLACETRITAGA